eukprot:2598591-Prymnesium_polylepis.1
MRRLAMCNSAVRVIRVGVSALVRTANPVSAPTPAGQPGAQCLTAEALQGAQRPRTPQLRCPMH